MSPKSSNLWLFPPLYLSLLSLISYLLSFLHIPLTRITYLLQHLFILVLLLKTLRLPRLTLKLLSVTLFPFFLSLLMLYQGLHTYLTPPNNHDASNHYFLISQILSTHTLNMSTIYHEYTQTTFYMLGFHNLVASLESLIPHATVTNFTFPLVWVLTSLYPLGVSYLTYQITHRRLSSLLGACISLTFPLFPLNVLGWGGWPFILGVTLLSFSLGQLVRFMKTQNRSNFVILILLLTGTLTFHSTEIIWFCLLSLPLLWQFRHRLAFPKLSRPQLGFAAAIVLFFIVFIAQALIRFFQASHSQSLAYYSLAQTLDVWRLIHTSINQSLIPSLIFFVALIYFLLKKKSLLLASPAAILLILWFIRNTTPWTHPFNQLLFPLFEPDRIYAYLGMFYGPLVALGIIQLANRFTLKPLIPIILTISICIVPLIKTINAYHLFLKIDTTVAKSDILLWQQHQTQCRLYLNDNYADAGRWIPYFSSSKILLDGPIEIYPDLENRLALLSLANQPDKSQEFCQYFQQHPFDCLFVGGQDTRKARKTLTLNNISQNPVFTLLDQQAQSAIFIPRCPAN